MDTLQFCYWLKGFFEIDGRPPTDAQWKIIREQLEKTMEKNSVSNFHKTNFMDSTSIKYSNFKREEPDAYL